MNRITKVILCLISILSLSTTAFAQRTIGTITASSGADNVVQLNPTATSQTIFIGLQITGTGTYLVEYLPINSTTWTSLKTCVKLTDFSSFSTTTSSLDLTCINVGFQSIRVRASSYSNGTGTIAINAVNSDSVVGINFGGGGATIGAVTQGAASDASNNWTVNCAVGCSSGTLTNNNAPPVNNHAAVLTAIANAAAVSYTEGNEVLPSVNLTGDLRTIAKQSGTWNIGTVTALTGITNPLPAGTNVIGHVIHDSGSTTAVTGNVTVIQGTGTNLHTVVDSGTVSTTWPGTLKAGGTAAMTGTTSTQVIAAQASNYLYIGSCSVNNTHATVDTLVDLQDGSGGTVIWTFAAAHSYGGESHTFPTPLRVPTLGNGLFAVDETTGASVKVFCQGYYTTVAY